MFIIDQTVNILASLIDVSNAMLQFHRQEHPQPVLEFPVVKGGSVHGTDLLVDSDGYRYSLKDHTQRLSIQLAQGEGLKAVWKCTVRKKNVMCHAKVFQEGDMFCRSELGHIKFNFLCKTYQAHFYTYRCVFTAKINDYKPVLFFPSCLA